MTTHCSLSYVLTTRNRLPYLRQLLPPLLQSMTGDEELIVTDGASTDGSKEFLEALHRDGRIHKLVSEPDQGEAHGYNKGLLMAAGELIKVLTSDDAYDYRTIGVCKRFMLENPRVDVLTTEGAAGFGRPRVFQRFEFHREFDKWMTAQRSVPLLPGPGLMLRRSSLPLLGLFDSTFVAVDREFVSRTTSGAAVWAFFTGLSFVGLPQPSSNQLVFSDRMEEERRRLKLFFRPHPRRMLVAVQLPLSWARRLSVLGSWIVAMGRLHRHDGRWWKGKLLGAARGPAPRPDHYACDESLLLEEDFTASYAWLAAENRMRPGQFIFPAGSAGRYQPPVEAVPRFG